MSSATSARPAVRLAALALGAVLLLVYNANGREIGSVDTQPTKFGARALALDHTLRLDRDVLAKPALAGRPAFARDVNGHYRSAYSVVPSIVAAVPAWILARTHMVDLDAPLGSEFVATTTASLTTAAAMALIVITLARFASIRVALFTAVSLGLGTNLWAVGSRTLWGIDAVALGLALALWAWLRPAAALTRRHLIIGGLGVALAVTTRMQTAPTAVVLIAWMWARLGTARTMWAAAPVAAGLAALFGAQYAWFGHVMGATARLEAVHLLTHDVSGSLTHTPITGALGLAISPSRGLFIFSPVLLLAVVGSRMRTMRADADLRLEWLFGAAVVQWLAYACYSVWWGGHTYGPRYMLDVLVPLAPAMAFGAQWAGRRRVTAALAVLLLGWSISAAALGAFVYPNEWWNTEPNVDIAHEKLWDWRDSQILRSWTSEMSPQNFDFFRAGALRRANPSH